MPSVTTFHLRFSNDEIYKDGPRTFDGERFCRIFATLFPNLQELGISLYHGQEHFPAEIEHFEHLERFTKLTKFTTI